MNPVEFGDASAGALPAPWAGPLDLSSDDFLRRTQAVLSSQPSLALQIGQRALAQAEAEGDAAGAIRALLLVGNALDILGQPERDDILALALARAEAYGEPSLLVYSVAARMVVDIYAGRYAEALARGQAVLGMAHVLRRDDLLGRLLNNLGSASSLIGEHRLAIEMYEERLRRLPPGDAAWQQRTRTHNNLAVAWLGLARTLVSVSADAAQARLALSRARALAEEACDGLLDDPNVNLRLSALDTLVGVLLEQGEATAALAWVCRTENASASALLPDTPQWGMATLARARVELALGAPAGPIVERLRRVEALPGPKFRSGEMHMLLLKAMALALERVGQYQEALQRHAAWVQADTRAHGVVAREHAIAVQNTLTSLRGETEEFITHDLRNPLAAALAQLSPGTLEALPTPLREGLRRARLSVLRAFNTAESYLAIVRTRTMRREDLQVIDLSALVDDVCEQTAPPAGAQVRLEREIDWDVAVHGDRISLMKALNQLLGNALRHAPPGSAVRLRLLRERQHAVLIVADDGNGMAPSMQTLLLRRVPMEDRRHGRGMGLTMVARIARLHDARVCVRSVPRRGTEVSLQFELLPAAQASTPVEDL